MSNTLTQTPLQYLQDLEQRTKQQARGLPRQTIVEPMWRGIAFRLGETYLVTPIEQILEVILYTGQLARVPGAKSWVKGLANIRGLLLPVIDLKDCLLKSKSIVIGEQTRMLMIKQDINQQTYISAGLLVDAVLGLKAFPEFQRDQETLSKESWLTDFADGLFIYEGITWTVFDMQKFAKSDSFLKAAL
ncbi:MAG: chemotaxis protein CheW [Thiomargarita sp.]|nr:chemotaxis protein CheW [Thiomargarita sp.]